MTSEPVAQRLLSHRLHGFDRFDNTAAGVAAALAIGVPHIELDLRVTSDGVLIASHDPYFLTDAGALDYYDAWIFDDLRKQHALTHLATFDKLLGVFAQAAKARTRLYVDVKIPGAEERVVAALAAAGIPERCVIISWLPDVIERFHRLFPALSLGFCHLSLARAPRLFGLAQAMLRPRLFRFSARALPGLPPPLATEVARVRLHFHADGDPCGQLPIAGDTDRMRYFEGHVVPDRLSGRMRTILETNGGLVCLPRHCLTRGLVKEYQDSNVRVAAYSVKSSAVLTRTINRYEPDLVCADADLIRAEMV
ncbi:MAG: glycerophosphodiester phosphodiesterase [Hyphomicrobiales bacterium]|nr:glycerophosphodiester phosphodiesterase [Hyphomicrobiales bacterium]